MTNDVPKFKFNAAQMREIKVGQILGIDISVYAKPEFDGLQMREIRMGLDKTRFEKNIKVSVYAKPEFDYFQMQEIRMGLENGVDVLIYAKPEIGGYWMGKIRSDLEKKVDVSAYFKPEFNEDQISEIQIGLRKGIDVSAYASPEFNYEQMNEIRKGLEDGVDVSVYAKPEFTPEQMKTQRMRFVELLGAYTTYFYDEDAFDEPLLSTLITRYYLNASGQIIEEEEKFGCRYYPDKYAHHEVSKKVMADIMNDVKQKIESGCNRYLTHYTIEKQCSL